MTHNDFIKSRLETIIDEMSHVNEENINKLSSYEVDKWRSVSHEYFMLTKSVSVRLHALAREAYNKAVSIDETRDYY